MAVYFLSHAVPLRPNTRLHSASFPPPTHEPSHSTAHFTSSAMASSAASGSRASIQPLSSEQQEAVIKSRMQVDERTLRRVVKKLTLLLSSTDAEVVAASRLSFQSELEAFRLQLARLSSIARNTSEVEISSYTHELSEIESEQEATQARIHALKRRLDEVRRERKNKLEYDVVAGEIVKLPTRAELDESLARLREQLDQVRAEREKYTHMSHDAAQRMRGVIDGLEALRNDVGYEVGERERREVERADGDADGEAGDAGAAGDDGSELGRGKRAGKDRDEPEEGEDDEREEGEQSAAVSRSGSSTPRRTLGDDEARPAAGSAATLNASAPAFRPGGTGTGRKRDSAAVAGSDEEGELDDGSSAGATAAAAASNSNTPRKRQRTEEGEVGTAGDSEEEEGSIRPAAAAAEPSRPARAGTKRRR